MKKASFDELPNLRYKQIMIKNAQTTIVGRLAKVGKDFIIVDQGLTTARLMRYDLRVLKNRDDCFLYVLE